MPFLYNINAMGKLIGIATRSEKRAPMDRHEHATVLFESGVGTDSRGLKRNHRQVTVLTTEAWSATCSDMNNDMPWTTRRANLLIEGIDLRETMGRKLKIGTVLLEITGELVPCNRMDEQYDGLTKTLAKDWRGGVTCRLLSEGEISVGDTVILEINQP